ncbi:hypothetical protein D3C81_2082940 [compost metagenome]
MQVTQRQLCSLRAIFSPAFKIQVGKQCLLSLLIHHARPDPQHLLARILLAMAVDPVITDLLELITRHA